MSSVLRPGIQALFWSLLARYFRIANVKHFGARGDGVTDDSAAIQSAVDALPSGGGIVFIPPGDYLKNSTVTIPSHVTLLGLGRLSVLRYDGNAAFTPQYLDMLGSSTTEILPSLLLNNVENAHLIGVHLQGPTDQASNARYVGALLIDTTSCHVLGCHATEINKLGAAQHGPTNARGWGLLTYGADFTLVLGGTWAGGGYENIGIRYASTHCVVAFTNQQPAWRTCMQMVSSDRCAFVLNRIHQRTLDPANTDSGLTLHHGFTCLMAFNWLDVETETGTGAIYHVGHASGETQGHNFVIGNVVRTNGQGIRIGPSRGGVVAFNHVESSSSHACRLSCPDAVVAFNWFTSAAPSALQLDGCTEALILGNYVYTPAHRAITVTMSGTTKAELRIIANYLRADDTSPLRFAANVSGCLILANSMHTDGQLGIEMNAGCDDNLIALNRLPSTSRGIDHNHVSRQRVGMNLGYKGETKGTDEIPDGQTSVVVEHGLMTTPGNLQITKQGEGDVWVSSRSPSSFTVSRADGSGALAFDWTARV